jgi:hypothetical protein
MTGGDPLAVLTGALPATNGTGRFLEPRFERHGDEFSLHWADVMLGSPTCLARGTTAGLLAAVLLAGLDRQASE